MKVAIRINSNVSRKEWSWSNTENKGQTTKCSSFSGQLMDAKKNTPYTDFHLLECMTMENTSSFPGATDVRN